MRLLRHVLFWLLSSLFLIFLISKDGSIYSSVFVTFFLMPVAITTSYLFNYWLFPKYLFQKKLLQFFLYSGFIVTLSIYLETLVILLSLIFQGNYSFRSIGPVASDVVQLAVGIYFIVFLTILITLTRRWSSKPTHSPSEELLHFKVNRKTLQLSNNDVNYFESLDDHVIIYGKKDSYTTKEKISHLEKRLPKSFIRVHRSYIVNTLNVAKFTKEQLSFGDTAIPISRKYKKEVAEKLTGSN